MDLAEAPKFTVDVWAFRQKFTVQNAPRQGRGTGRWYKSRAFLPGATLALKGHVVYAGYPLPDDWRGQEGEITLTFHKGAKQVVSVRVIEAEIAMAAEGTGWDIALVCLVTANPTMSGFGGEQPEATDPDKSDQELYAALAKTADPNNLLTSAQRQYDVWPLGDTDEAERVKLTNIIATATANAFAGAKVKLARLEPGRSDDAGIVTVQLSLTDTVEDVVNPITQTTIDPEGLASNATAAGINETPVGPGGDFVARDTTTREIHDAATLTAVSYGLRDHKEDVEMPGSTRTQDPRELVQEERRTLVTASGTPPATPTPTTEGLVLRAVRREQLNRLKWAHTFVFAPRDSEQDIVFPGSPRNVDPSSLGDTEQVTDVTDSEDPPATPTPDNAALKHRGTTSIRLTDSGKWQHVFEFARRNREDDAEMGNSSTLVDVSNLESQQQVAVVASSGTPSWPSTPGGLKQRNVRSVQLHDTRWLHTYLFARTTTEDDVEMGGSLVVDDASDLADSQTFAILHTSATASGVQPVAPSGLKIRDTKSKQLNDEHWLHTFEFARTNREDDIENAGTVTRLDPSLLADHDTVTEITASATPESAPESARAAELTHTATETVKLHDGKWRHTYHFGRLTRQQQIEFEASPDDRDPKSIEDREQITRVTTAAAPEDAATVITPLLSIAGLKHRRTLSVKLTADTLDASPDEPAKWKHTFFYARNDTEDDVLLPLNVTEADPEGITSSQQKATLSGVAPTLDAGYSVLETVTKTLVTGKTLTIVRGGLNSSKEQIERSGTEARFSPFEQTSLTTTEVLDDDENTVADLATEYGLTRNLDPTFDWVRYVRLNAEKVKRTVGETADFELVRAVSDGGLRTMTSAAGFVWLSRKLKRGTISGVTLHDVLILPLTRLRFTVDFTIRRRAVMNPAVPLFLHLSGHANAANFMGFPAGMVSYVGGAPMWNNKIPTPRMVDILYRFHFDSFGIYDDTPVQLGWRSTTADLDGVDENSLVAASVFGWGLSIPPQSDFDVFLPPPPPP